MTAEGLVGTRKMGHYLGVGNYLGGGGLSKSSKGISRMWISD